MDLFEHEVLIAALFRCLGIPCDLKHLLRNRRPEMIRHLDRILADHCHFSVTEDICTTCLGNDGRNIGGDKVLPLTKSNDKRIVLLRADE